MFKTRCQVCNCPLVSTSPQGTRVHVRVHICVSFKGAIGKDFQKGAIKTISIGSLWPVSEPGFWGRTLNKNFWAKNWISCNSWKSQMGIKVVLYHHLCQHRPFKMGSRHQVKVFNSELKMRVSPSSYQVKVFNSELQKGVSPSLHQVKAFWMGTQVAIVISTLRGHQILRPLKSPKLLGFFSLLREQLLWIGQ